MSEAARSRRDEGRYEPHVAVPGREGATFDPLAELARLVGQDDPFRNVFRPAAGPAAQGPGQAARDPYAPESRAQAGEVSGYDHRHGEPARYDDGAPDHVHDPQGQGGGHHPETPHHAGHDDAAYHHDGYDAAAYDGHHGDDGHGHRHEAAYAEDNDRYYAAEQAAHPDEAGSADERMAPASGLSALPDMWARGEAGVAPDVDHGDGPVSVDRPPSSARRPVAVLAAVLLLTGGGLGASFLAKSGAVQGVASSSAGRGAPTIMAASGPTKVKVDDGSETAPEDQDAALLNKSANLPSGPVKIVSSQEQPADLAQLPKSDLADGARPLPPPVPSPFPEPKKVKTFVVHPDGSMLSGDAAPAASSVAAPAPSTGGEVTAALPATPRTAARGGTTPKVAIANAEPTIASLSTDLAVADPAAPAAVGTTTPPKPARPASATAGSYGVQLASSPVEADANAAFAKLKKRFPAQLGSYTATVHKAETGDKPVYRVRVGGMSQDEAKALCTQLQTAGGACLVMHN